jgi:arylsulfatase A-like enzyme
MENALTIFFSRPLSRGLRLQRDGRWLFPSRFWRFAALWMVMIPSARLEAANPAQDAKEQDYNIILIAVTNVGTRHMGLYGYHRETTPNLDRFAKESVVFDNFYTPASWTLPTGVSLFTSLPPYAHGVMNRWKLGNSPKPVDRLSDDTASLIDILKSHGYVTAGFTGGFDYRASIGLTKRFDQFLGGEAHNSLEEMVDKRLMEERRLGSIAEGASQAIRWIDQHGQQKFFLFLQGYDAHCPFNPKGEFDRYFVDFDASDVQVDPYHCYRQIEDGEDFLTFTSSRSDAGPSGLQRIYGEAQLTEKDTRCLEAQYDAEIRYVDHHLGWFLDQLRKRHLLENSMILILSEHGEMFAKNGRFGRAGRFRGTLYEDVIHVPLIIRHPQWRPGRVKELAQMIDVAPTLLEVFNIARPRGFYGRSLLPSIERGTPVHQVIYGGSIYGRDDFKYYNIRTVNEYARDGEYKLIHEMVYAEGQRREDRYELYHIFADPQEQKNLVDSEREVAADLKRKLRNWSEKWRKEKEDAIRKLKIHIQQNPD